MFEHSSQIDYSIDEGTVTEVDSGRKICRVKSLSGQNLNRVQWMLTSGGSSRGGDRDTPSMGDRVVFHTGLGYPLIIGYLPRLQGADNNFPINIDQGESIVDTGSFSQTNDAVNGDRNSSGDMVSGDRIITSSGGGLMGILRGGSILLRSSRLSEIFISKWDDIVRIVSRNWEHYTDVSSDIIKNIAGRVYRYTGYSNLYKEAKIEDYKFHQYAGDVTIAESVKTNYANPGSPGAIDDRVYKEQITGGSGGSAYELMKREIHLNGDHDIVIKNQDGTTFTRVYHTKDEVIVTYNDVNVIKINDGQINITKGGNATINLDDNGIQCTYSGHFVLIHTGGVHLG